MLASLRVLRLCSVFEPPDAVLAGRGVRFDPIGGMQNHAACLTRALDRRGARQAVLTSRPPGAPAVERLGAHAQVHRFGVPVPVARQGWGAGALKAGLRLGADADLVHAHLGEDLAVLPVAHAVAARHGLPVVVTVHTSLRHTFVADGPRSRLLKATGGRIEAWGTGRAAGVIALTRRLAQRVGHDRVDVIPSGVVPADFDPAVADPLAGIPHPRVLFVGRLARQKGVRVLAEAATLLRTCGAQLVVAGDGPDRAAFEATVRAAGAQDHVHVLGFRPHDQVPALLAHADVFVLPSIYEELGSVLLEAMQAGLPIVASRTGGVPETLGDAALLVPPGDAAALAGAVDGLLADPAGRGALAVRAHARAHAFDWEGLADRVLDVYLRALDDRTPVVDLGRAPVGAAATA